jgi:hypothetical protein
MYEKVYTYDKVLCYYSPITVLLSQIENCCAARAREKWLSVYSVRRYLLAQQAS